MKLYIQDVLIEREDNYIKVSNRSRETIFSGSNSFIDKFMQDMQSYPTYSPINYNSIVRGVRAKANNIGEVIDIEELIDPAAHRIVSKEYGLLVSKMYVLNPSTCFIESEGIIYVLGIGTRKYKFVCDKWQHNRKPLRWEEVFYFTSREEVESKIRPFIVEQEQIKRPIYKSEDASDI